MNHDDYAEILLEMSEEFKDMPIHELIEINNMHKIQIELGNVWLHFEEDSEDAFCIPDKDHVSEYDVYLPTAVSLMDKYIQTRNN